MDWITVTDFKTYFDKDFPYLPIWIDGTIYNKGDKAYYELTKLFYICLNDGTVAAPTDTQNWAKTQDNYYDYINDSDIEKAIGQMKCMLPLNRLPETIREMAQLWLTAHCLIHDIRCSNAGLASTMVMPVTSRTVGSVSESYGLSQKFLQNPAFAFYVTSNYGLKYLSLVLPYILVTVGVVSGWTQP